MIDMYIAQKGLKLKDDGCRSTHIINISRYRASEAISHFSTNGVRKYMDNVPVLHRIVEEAIWESTK